MTCAGKISYMGDSFLDVSGPKRTDNTECLWALVKTLGHRARENAF